VVDLTARLVTQNDPKPPQKRSNGTKWYAKTNLLVPVHGDMQVMYLLCS
jgi:hypothetical protein